MMGRLKHEQAQLFYEFALDEVVPDDHLVRGIAAVLDLSWVRAELASYYSPLGRPSIDPVLMIRLLIIGYVFAIIFFFFFFFLKKKTSLVLRLEHRGQNPGSFGILARSQ